MMEGYGSLWLFDEVGNHLPSVELRNDGSPDARSARSKVLIVDDERLIADTLGEILKLAGFQVAVVYDAWQAIETAMQFQPNQLLTDVKMPRMNGVELAIAIRKMYPDTRIILFSAQAGVSEALLDAAGRGYEFEVLAKPLRPSILIEHLKKGCD